VSPVYCKKIDSIRTKLTGEIHFEICHSGNLQRIEWYALVGSGLHHQRAAAVDEQHRRAAIEGRRAFRTVGIQNCWRSELGAQSGLENQPACLSVCL